MHSCWDTCPSDLNWTAEAILCQHPHLGPAQPLARSQCQPRALLKGEAKCEAKCEKLQARKQTTRKCAKMKAWG